jgi:hypothetical protein
MPGQPVSSQYNVPIPRAAGEDFFTSRMVRDWKVFPYGWNIAPVVSAVMDKDRQGAAQKCQAVVRLHEARPKRQRGAAKATAPDGGQPPLAAVGPMLRRRRSYRKKRSSAEAVCIRWPKVPLREASVLQTDLKIE